MGIFALENEQICIEVNSLGAELKSLKDKESGREYMWCGDEMYWGRTSPILFPVVGNYKDKICRWQGKTYALSQHGFARDLEFMMTAETENEIWFCLTDKEDTWDLYPFAFALEVGYRLIERTVEVMWKVSNPAEETMYFSIGGHPAFSIPLREENRITCYLGFDKEDSLINRGIRDGYATEETTEVKLQGNLLPVEEKLFEADALVIENDQVHRVELLDENKSPFLTVDFEAPLFGIWMPYNRNTPFICIEPWYGRCDKEDFTGQLDEREWGNSLTAGEVFEASYRVTV